MNIVFDWEKPFLDSATEWLISKSESTEHIDLSRYLLLCPVARISRRLIEKLVFAGENKKIAVSAPQLLSLSKIYEILLPNIKVVSEAESRLIFLGILEKKQGLNLFSSIDGEETELQLLDRANFLAQTYLEITKNGLEADLSIQQLLSSDLPGDHQRWQELSEIFHEYKQKLKENKLIDTVEALQLVRNSPTKIDAPLILMGGFDLSDVIVQTIEAGFSEIINLIFSDPARSNAAFNSSGTLNTDYWLEAEVNVDDFKICANPSAEAENIFLELQKLPAKTNPGNITVGCCAPSIDKFFAFKAKEYKLPVHLVSGTNLLNTELCQALVAALSYLQSKSFADLSYLVAIPAVYNRLTAKSEARYIIDDYRINHLQPVVHQKLPAFGESEKKLLSEIESLLKCLEIENDSAENWLKNCRLFISLLDLEPEKSSPVITALEQLLNDISSLKISDKAVSTLISETFSVISSKQNSEQDEIDLVGWLELTLDDAEFCFVTGMNEKNLPSRPSANSLLPEKARQLLSLDSYLKRLARDKYILQSLLNSKKYLSLSCSRMSAEGDGLILSRLFLEGSEENKIKNLERFFKDQLKQTETSSKAGHSTFSAGLKQKLLPEKNCWKSNHISVSAFNLYYQCPYLFYLQVVQQLETENPNQRELNGAQLGNLIHNVLADFGKSEIKDSVKSSEISEFLERRLNYYFNKDYDKSSFAEVRVQYFQIAERLRRFAAWQAKWRESGWQIHQAELSFKSDGLTLSTKSGILSLKGRIDRIDYNPELKEYAVFDYKTSDSISSKSYSSRQGWQDLQLPVYWIYCKEILGFEASKMALLHLAASDLELEPDFIDVSAEKLLESRELLTDTASQLLDNIFWPPELKADKAFDFKNIYLAVED